MREAPSNTDDVIDSRDVIARIKELEGEREALIDGITEATEEDESEEKAGHIDGAKALLEERDSGEEGAKLKALQALAEEAEGYAPDWPHGATLIRESYFVEYCKELCADIGDVPKELPGYLVIDWDATAENLKADYTEVDFDGTVYYVR